jgi:alpha-amylase
LTDRLVYDQHRRSMWIEHLLPPDAEPEAFWQQRHAEWGDFVGQPFGWRVSDGTAAVADRGSDTARSGAPRRTVTLERCGEAVTEQGVWPVTLTKAFTVPASGTTLEVRYRLRHAVQRPLEALFAIECNAAVYDPRYSAAVGRAEPGRRVEIRDQWMNAQIVQEVDPAPELWHGPIQTVSESEEGLERTYQGLCWLLVWPLRLEAGAEWSTTIRQTVIGP